MAKDMQQYLRPESQNTPFCPGCGHGILMGLILRAIDKLDLNIDKTLFVSGIGCAAWIPSPHFQADTLHTLHGRAVAFATGAKLFNPELTTIVISGDGDLASIGGNHLIHAARRDIDLTVICANNMIYGMTGGQQACTSPLGTIVSTYPKGNPHRPFDLAKLVSSAGASYVARYSVTQPMALIKSLSEAILVKGFSFVEVLSPCITQYGRRNQYSDPASLIKMLYSRCITIEEARKKDSTDLKNYFVTGVFTNQQ